MAKRRASIKETGEELSPADWERFDAAVAATKAEREGTEARPDAGEQLAGDARAGATRGRQPS